MQVFFSQLLTLHLHFILGINSCLFIRNFAQQAHLPHFVEKNKQDVTL